MENDGLLCCGERMAGVKYGYGHPDRYDGVSEWVCQQCGKRIGRWTRNELQPGETEKRYGGQRE